MKNLIFLALFLSFRCLASEYACLAYDQMSNEIHYGTGSSKLEAFQKMMETTLKPSQKWEKPVNPLIVQGSPKIYANLVNSCSENK